MKEERKWKVNLMHVKKTCKAFTSDYYQLLPVEYEGSGTSEHPNGFDRLI